MLVNDRRLETKHRNGDMQRCLEIEVHQTDMFICWLNSDEPYSHRLALNCQQQSQGRHIPGY